MLSPVAYSVGMLAGAGWEAKARVRCTGELCTGTTAVCVDIDSRSDCVTGGERNVPPPTSTCGISASVLLQLARAATRPRLAMGVISFRIVQTVRLSFAAVL
ncbi:hypothetical protein [Ensifer sp. 1H6]|uniref:hypothetical protein n=1 Tax=Ensifer sp. 1H6 TaxID=1911585 RepID=UPI001FD9EB25|nr:hypothetical protein [Ensifer sp. 1H6]